MEPVRASILQRPLKEPSRATLTSADKQYEAEQERLRAKAQRAGATQDRLLRSLYPTPEDKAANLHDAQEHLREQSLLKMQQRQQAAEWEAKYAPPGPDAAARGPGVAQVLAVADDRPWLNPSMAYGSDAEERLARRRHEEEVAAANRHLMHEASLQRSLAEQQELQYERSQLQAPAFWNIPSNPRLPPGFTVPPTPTASHQAAPPPWAVAEHAYPAPATNQPPPNYHHQPPPTTAKLVAPYATAADPAPPPYRPTAQPPQALAMQGGRVRGPPGAAAPPPFAVWDGPVPTGNANPHAAMAASPEGGPAAPQQAAGLRYAARPPSSQAAPFATHEGVIRAEEEELQAMRAAAYYGAPATAPPQPYHTPSTFAAGYGQGYPYPTQAPARAQAPPSSMGQLLGSGVGAGPQGGRGVGAGGGGGQGGSQRWEPSRQAPDFCWSWKP